MYMAEINNKISGKVFRGKREGSKIGFPTANIHIQETIEPGIYAGYANIDAAEKLKSMFYVDNDVLECHIFDFPKNDLYESEISVEILHKIRGVQEFTSLEEAKYQISKDEIEARKWFKSRED